jgi:hypothetical protein
VDETPDLAAGSWRKSEMDYISIMWFFVRVGCYVASMSKRVPVAS